MEKSPVQKIIENFEHQSVTYTINGNKILPKNTKKSKENTNKRERKHNWFEYKRFKKSPGHFISILQSICVFTMITLMVFYILYGRIQLQLAIAAPTSFIMGISATLAFTYSLAFRCVSVLSATIVPSSQGRMILLSVITGLLVGGPLISIVHNTNEASVTISCTADLAQEYMKNMSAAYREAYNDMTEALMDNIKVWVKISNGVQKALDPIRNGIRNAQDKFQDAQNSMEEAAAKCDQGISEAYRKCGQGATKAYQDCKRKVSFNFQAIPDKIGGAFDDVGEFFKGRKKRASGNFNDICEVINIGKAVCEPFEQINVCEVLQAPKSIVSQVLLAGTNLFSSFAELFNFKLNIDKATSSNLNSSINHTEINQLIRDEFEKKYSVVLYIIYVVQIILIMPILIVPISAGLYLRKYLKFKSKVESNYLHDFMKKQKTRDRSHRNLQLVQLLTHCIFSLTIICFDYTLYWIESVVNKHGTAIFSAEGEVKLVFNSQGGPILKPIIDQFVETFKLTRTHNFTVNTNRCLPEPMSPSGLSFIVPISLIYACAFVFVFTEFYFASFKPMIISYFYPGSESITSEAKQVEMESMRILVKNKK